MPKFILGKRIGVFVIYVVHESSVTATMLDAESMPSVRPKFFKIAGRKAAIGA